MRRARLETRGPTCGAGVIHHNDLRKQGGGRGMQNAVHRAQERRPRLVVEHDDDAGGRQRRAVAEFALHAPEETRVSSPERERRLEPHPRGAAGQERGRSGHYTRVLEKASEDALPFHQFTPGSRGRLAANSNSCTLDQVMVKHFVQK